MSIDGDLDGDGRGDIVVSAAGSDESVLDGGAVYICELPGSFEDVPLDACGTRLLGELPSDWAGDAIDSSGDLDGDGLEDLIVGAPGVLGCTHGGYVYVLYGPVGVNGSLSQSDAKLYGEGTTDQAGTAVATGDLDGDGLDDLLIGAPQEDTAALDVPGVVYVVFGPVYGTFFLSNADLVLTGEQDDALTGVAPASGEDVNGDGNHDLVVSATGSVDRAYLVYGPLAAGEHSLADADAIFDADQASGFGYQVALGDLNADGYADVLVSDFYYQDWRGGIFGFLGSAGL